MVNIKNSLVAFTVTGVSLFAASTANAGTTTIDTPVVNSSSSSVSVVGALELKSGYDHVGTYILVPKSKIKTKGKGKKKLDCSWTKNGETWTNSMNENGSSFAWYEEETRAKLCKLKKPIKRGGKKWTHVKVAGGKTGSPCFNLALPPKAKQPKPLIEGNIMDQRELDYEVSYEIKGNASLSALATCVSNSGSASATAYGSGLYSAVIKIRVRAKSRVEATTKGASGITVKQKQEVELEAQGNARLDLAVKANASCNDVPPPPTCEDRGDCPNPVVARCDELQVETDLTIARGIRARVLYTAQGTDLTKVTFNWGDGTQTSGSATVTGHQYSAAGTYTVYVTLEFRDVKGQVTSSTCAATTVTAKDGTTGVGSGTPGQPGGPGAGGTPGTGSGPKCRNSAGDIVDGTPDQFGNC